MTIAERPRVLVVDEIPSVIRMLSLELSANGYDVEGVQLGPAVFEAILRLRPAAVILELVLPGASGIELLKELRRGFPDIPVVVLTTQDTEADRTECLELGAADFLGKPFSPEDLSFRINLATGRIADPPPVLRIGAYEVDVGRRLVRAGRNAISVSTNEWALHLALLEANGAPRTPDELATVLFGSDGAAELTEQWVRRLRERLQDDPSSPNLIVGDGTLGFSLRRD